MTGSRRSFLKMWAAAPALGLAPSARAVARSSFDPWVEVRPRPPPTQRGADPPPGGGTADPGRHQEQWIRPGRGRRRASHRGRAGHCRLRGRQAARGGDAARRRRTQAHPLHGAARRERPRGRGGAGHPAHGLHAGGGDPRADRGSPRTARVAPCLRGHRDRPRGRAVSRGRPAPPRPRAEARPDDRGHDDDLHRGRGVRPRAAAPVPGAVRRAHGRGRLPRPAPRRFELRALPERERVPRHGAAGHGDLRRLLRASLPRAGRDGPAARGRLEGARRLREAAARGRQRRLQPGLSGARGCLGGHAPRGPRRRLAPPRGQGRPGQDQWRDVPHRGHGLREPLHRPSRPRAAGAHRRRRHSLRLGRRLTPGGPGRRLRRRRSTTCSCIWVRCCPAGSCNHFRRASSTSAAM